MNNLKTDKYNGQLAAARAVLAETGKSPRELGRVSRLKILEWIYQWGFTSSSVGQLLLGRTSGGYLQKLSKQSWLMSIKTKSGVPAAYFTLSQIALEEAERHANSLCKYLELDPYKVDQSKIRHYLIAQTSTINALRAGLITDYQTERMFGVGGDKLGVKRPDVVWVTPTGLRYGIEVELSAKWERQLDDFVLKVIRALKSNGDNSSEFSRFVIVSDSPAIINRYSTAMQSGQPLAIWEKSDRGHWVIQKTIRVPDWLISRVDFKLIES
ncbi:MAG: hypothetical protein HOP25_02795 [Methylotenera sp.]|nr:hypothetical protein [Methylotenera sp.]